jgi:hypothetical protein
MEMIDRLREKASSLPEVKLAVLFGSRARGEERPRSDVDLGVLLETYTPDLRFKVEAELGRAAGREVDVVLLDDAPPLLRFEIARDGVLLFQREDHLWTDIKARAMLDWWDWAPTYRQILAGAMRRLRGEEAGYPADGMGRKATQARVWLEDAAEILSRPPEEVLADVKGLDLATFYLFLSIQGCIDLAAYWIADAGWDVPDDSASLFELLAKYGALDRALVEALRGAVGLRNRIAHGYISVVHARVLVEYHRGVEALRRFLSLMAAEAGL